MHFSVMMLYPLPPPPFFRMIFEFINHDECGVFNRNCKSLQILFFLKNFLISFYSKYQFGFILKIIYM